MAGAGKWVKSMGTTKNPRVLKLAHHRAATQIDSLDIRSDVANGYHFIAFDSAGRLYFSCISLLLAN